MWLYERYGRHDDSPAWAELPPSSRIWWQEEADTVIKAVIKLALYKIVPK